LLVLIIFSQGVWKKEGKESTKNDVIALRSSQGREAFPRLSGISYHKLEKGETSGKRKVCAV